jgi:hypothetical protein
LSVNGRQSCQTTNPTLINPNATETAAAMESNFHMELTSANIDHRSGVVMDRPMKGFLKFFVVIFPGWDFGNPEGSSWDRVGDFGVENPRKLGIARGLCILARREIRHP